MRGTNDATSRKYRSAKEELDWYKEYWKSLDAELDGRNMAHDKLVDLYHRHSQTFRAPKDLKEGLARNNLRSAYGFLSPIGNSLVLWPSLDLTSLSDHPEPSLGFLCYRATTSATAYMDMDYRSTYVAHADTDTVISKVDFAWLQDMRDEDIELLEATHKLNFQDTEPHYTTTIKLKERSENVFEFWNGISARQVAGIQSHLYRVLAEVVLNILDKAGIPFDQRCDDSVHPRLPTTSLSVPKPNNTKYLLLFYYGPTEFDLI